MKDDSTHDPDVGERKGYPGRRLLPLTDGQDGISGGKGEDVGLRTGGNNRERRSQDDVLCVRENRQTRPQESRSLLRPFASECQWHSM